jgi:hypothetical protein
MCHFSCSNVLSLSRHVLAFFVSPQGMSFVKGCQYGQHHAFPLTVTSLFQHLSVGQPSLVIGFRYLLVVHGLVRVTSLCTTTGATEKYKACPCKASESISRGLACGCHLHPSAGHTTHVQRRPLIVLHQSSMYTQACPLRTHSVVQTHHYRKNHPLSPPLHSQHY